MPGVEWGGWEGRESGGGADVLTEDDDGVAVSDGGASDDGEEGADGDAGGDGSGGD